MRKYLELGTNENIHNKPGGFTEAIFRGKC